MSDGGFSLCETSAKPAADFLLTYDTALDKIKLRERVSATAEHGTVAIVSSLGRV